MHAEALGLRFAAKYATENLSGLCTSCTSPMEIVFQMDNLPIIRHLNKEAKCTHLGTATAVAETLATICPKISKLTFEYIPRESNFFGDLAAGWASSSVLAVAKALRGEATQDAPDSGPLFVNGTAHLSLPVLISNHTVKAPPKDSVVCLTEIPVIDLQLLRAYNDSLAELQRTPHWAQYLSLLLGKSGDFALTVTYRSRRGARLYATSPAAQLLSANARLFLFGRNHVEVDLVAAAFQLYIFAVSGSLTFRDKTAVELREEIRASLRAASAFFSPEEVKRLINVFLNTSAQKVIHIIHTKTLFPPANVLSLFRQLEELRPNLLKTACGYGFDPSIGEDHNICFFALEFLEQHYVRNFLSALCDALPLTSVILVHDGIYLSPQVSVADLAIASAKAAKVTNVPVLHFSCHQLDTLWNRTFGHIDRRVAHQRLAAKRPRFGIHSDLTHQTDQTNSQAAEPNPFLQSKQLLSFDPTTKRLEKKRAHITQFNKATTNQHKRRRLVYETTATNSHQRTAVFETTASKSTLFAYFKKKRLFGMD